jgi:serine phosphatase RsbU (regulator of sigma subunit)
MTMDSYVFDSASASTCSSLNERHTRHEKNQQSKFSSKERTHQKEDNEVLAIVQGLSAQVLETVRCEAARSAKLQNQIMDEVIGIQEETASNSAELLSVKQVLNEIRQSLDAHVRASDNNYSTLAGQVKVNTLASSIYAIFESISN